jgi:hypothetical protein
MESVAYTPTQIAINKKRNGTNLEGFYVADCVDFMAAMLLKYWKPIFGNMWRLSNG